MLHSLKIKVWIITGCVALFEEWEKKQSQKSPLGSSCANTLLIPSPSKGRLEHPTEVRHLPDSHGLATAPVISMPSPQPVQRLPSTSAHPVVVSCLWSSPPFPFPSHSYRNYYKVNFYILYFIQQHSNSKGFGSWNKNKRSSIRLLKFLGKNLLRWFSVAEKCQLSSHKVCVVVYSFSRWRVVRLCKYSTNLRV